MLLGSSSSLRGLSRTTFWASGSRFHLWPLGRAQSIREPSGFPRRTTGCGSPPPGCGALVERLQTIFLIKHALSVASVEVQFAGTLDSKRHKIDANVEMFSRFAIPMMAQISWTSKMVFSERFRQCIGFRCEHHHYRNQRCCQSPTILHVDHRDFETRNQKRAISMCSIFCRIYNDFTLSLTQLFCSLSITISQVTHTDQPHILRHVTHLTSYFQSSRQNQSII